MLLFQNSQYNDAITILEDVVKSYRGIHHVWGEINAKTLLLLCKAKNGENGIEDEVSDLKAYAEKMNYRYNVYILDTFIRRGDVDYFQLFFL